MSDNAAIADAVYPGGPATAPATAPTATQRAAPAAAETPAPAPAPAAEPAAPAAGADTETTSTILTEKEEAAAETEKPAEPPPEPFDAEKLVIPEGMKADPELLGKFGDHAKAHGLTQKAAQDFVDLYHSVSVAREQKFWDDWNATQAGLVAEVKADPYLGPNWNAVKQRVGALFADPALGDGPAAFKVINDTYAGNHVPLIRFLDALAKEREEGTHVDGNGPVRQAAERSLAERIYPNLAER